MKRFVIYYSLALVLSPGVFAAVNGEEYFDIGKQAYRHGEWDQSILAFKQALSRGYENGAIHHNLGVVYYKSGFFREAYHAFIEASRYENFRASAYFNLALVKIKQSDYTEATSWLQLVKDNHLKRDDLIYLAAETLLNRIDTAKLLEENRHIVLLVNATMGTENYNMASRHPLISIKSNQYFENTLSASTGVFEPVYRTNIGTDIYTLINNQNEHDDLIITRVFLDKILGRRATRFTLQGNINYANLGDNSYYQGFGLNLKYSNQFTDRVDLKIKYYFTWFDALNRRFDAITGSQQKLLWSLSRKKENRELKINYEWETNYRDDQIIANEFTTYTMMRNSFGIHYTKLLNLPWSYELGTDFFQSDYSDPKSLGSADKRRIDSRWNMNAQLQHKINKLLSWGIKYEFLHQNSTISIFEFKRHQFSTFLELFTI